MVAYKLGPIFHLWETVYKYCSFKISAILRSRIIHFSTNLSVKSFPEHEMSRHPPSTIILGPPDSFHICKNVQYFTKNSTNSLFSWFQVDQKELIYSCNTALLKRHVSEIVCARVCVIIVYDFVSPVFRKPFLISLTSNQFARKCD